MTTNILIAAGLVLGVLILLAVAVAVGARLGPRVGPRVGAQAAGGGPAVDPDALFQRLFETNEALLAKERAVAASELDGKKALIDQQLGTMHTELQRVGQLVRELEGDRRRAFGELTNELQRQREGLATLTDNTAQLRDVLANPQRRGQWGERMAEDVLRLAGFVEDVNYRKQTTLTDASGAGGGRPDYTFLLPNDLVLHMDVKFPLDNYARFVASDNDAERTSLRDQFLRDVRSRVKELKTRGYLDAGDETVDCLLLFIPNESVYAFVHEHDPGLLDEALRQRIVLCSPLTLYAVLAVVRQAVDNFRLERTSNEILTLLGQFNGQWEKYTEQLEKVQRRFDDVAKDYAHLMTTRQRQLQRPLDRIQSLRNDTEAGTDALLADDAVAPVELRPMSDEARARMA